MKTKISHTPRPCIMRKTVDAFNVGHPIFGVELKIDEAGHFVTEQIYETDARLIAAAPELLESLKHIQNLAEENMKGQDGYKTINEWCLKAIAKATGEIK